MKCRICREENTLFKYVCRNESCLPICYDCGEINSTCLPGHILDESLLSPFSKMIVESSRLAKDWTERCKKAQQYIPQIDQLFIISKAVLEQKELQELQIVTDLNVKKEIQDSIGFMRMKSINYFRNPYGTIITSMDISIKQTKGADLTNFGKTNFRFELRGNGSTFCTVRVPFTYPTITNTFDCCFLAHNEYTRMLIEVLSDFEWFEWDETKENIDLNNREPEYEIKITFTSAAIGGNHQNSFTDGNVNFSKLCPGHVLFHPSNIMCAGGVIGRYVNEDADYDEIIRDFKRDCVFRGTI